MRSRPQTGPPRSSIQHRSRAGEAIHRRKCLRRFAHRVRLGHTPPVSWHIRRGRHPAGDTRSGLSRFRPHWCRGNRPCRPEYRPWLRDDRQCPLLARHGLCSLDLLMTHAQPPRPGFPADRHARKVWLTPERELRGQQVSHQGRAQKTCTASYADTHAIGSHHSPRREFAAGARSPMLRRAATPPFDEGFPHMLHSTFQEIS